jgi:hypothetical protein
MWTTSSIGRSRAVEPGLQRLAFDELHHQVGQAIHLVDAVDGNNVLVVDGSGGLGFADEPAASVGAAGQDESRDLDGHQSPQGRIERLQHDTHPSLPDHFEHLIRVQ